MPISIKYDIAKKQNYVYDSKTSKRYYFISGSDRSYKMAYSKAQRESGAVNVPKSEGSDKPKKETKPKSTGKSTTKRVVI